MLTKKADRMFLIMAKWNKHWRARVMDKSGKDKQKLEKDSKDKGTTESKVDPYSNHSNEHSAENKIHWAKAKTN